MDASSGGSIWCGRELGTREEHVRKRGNSAAKDYWAQILSRLAQSEFAAVMDPEYDPSEDQKIAHEAYISAGWSEEEIRARMQVDNALLASAPVTSPGTNPYAEIWLDRLCNDVESAMSRLQCDSYLRVARGIEPTVGPSASKINVIMTDESVITVGAHTFRFCGLIAKAFVRTLHLNAFFWEARTYLPSKARLLLQTSPLVMGYWFSIFMSYAITGTNVRVPFAPAKRHELALSEQVARSMELFAVAHEYGHHHFAHGKCIDNASKDDEYEADNFALEICYEIERSSLAYQNPYLASGAGGILLLFALDILRRFENVIDANSATTHRTHPCSAERISKLRPLVILDFKQQKSLNSFCCVTERIMRLVQHELLGGLNKLSRMHLNDLSALKARCRAANTI